MSKIVKNTTASPYNISDVGITIPASSSYTIPETDYLLWAASQDVITGISSTDIVINDGTTDLSSDEGLRYIIYPNQLTIQEDDSVISRYIKDLNFSDDFNVSDDGGGKISINVTQKNPDNIIYVATNGSDTTGDGTVHNPYLTIKFACDSITDDSATNRYKISVSPGLYEENNPISCPSYTVIEGSSNVSVRVIADNPSSNLFVLDNNTELKGLSLNGTTSASLVYGNGTGNISLLTDLTIANAQYGINIVDGYCLVRNLSMVPIGDAMTDCVRITGTGFIKVQIVSYLFASAGNIFYVNGAGAFLNVEEAYIREPSSLTNLVLVENGGHATFDSITVDGNNDVGTGFKCDGDGSRIFVSSSYLKDLEYGFYVDNSGFIKGFSCSLDCATGIYMDNSAMIEFFSMCIDNCDVNINVQNSNCTVIFEGGDVLKNRVFFPPETKGVGFFIDRQPEDEGLDIFGKLRVGRADKGSYTAMGEGGAYTAGINVLTSDNTASSTTDGGNITDVTTEAQNLDADTLTFQGNGANYCIYVSSDVQNRAWSTALDYARLTGVRIDQTTASIYSSTSFIFEYWDGDSWEKIYTMCHNADKDVSYANNCFLRTNSTEFVQFGAVQIEDMQKKTINSKERYWVRIRMLNSVTQLPVFDEIRVSNNRTEILPTGTIHFHGQARYVQSISFQANTFGETGGVTNAVFDVGSGSIPNAWKHSMKNNQLNGNGDAIYGTSVLPEGVCTSCPITVKVKYLVLNSGTSSNGTLKVSFLPIQASGVFIADPSGGINPIERPVASTDEITDNAADSSNISIDLATSNKILTAESQYFYVEDYYEGDLLFIRVEFDDDGDGNKNIAILGIDIECVRWSLGSKLRIPTS